MFYLDDGDHENSNDNNEFYTQLTKTEQKEVNKNNSKVEAARIVNQALGSFSYGAKASDNFAKLGKSILNLRYALSSDPTKAIEAYSTLSKMFKSTLGEIKKITKLGNYIKNSKLGRGVRSIFKRKDGNDRVLYGAFKKAANTILSPVVKTANSVLQPVKKMAKITFNITKKILTYPPLVDAAKIALIGLSFTPPLTAIGAVSAGVMAGAFALNKTYTAIKSVRDQKRMNRHKNLLSLIAMKQQLAKVLPPDQTPSIEIKSNLQKQKSKTLSRLKIAAKSGYGTTVGVLGAAIDLGSKIASGANPLGFALAAASITSGGISEVLSFYDRKNEKKALRSFDNHLKKELNIEQLSNKQIRQLTKEYNKTIDTLTNDPKLNNQEAVQELKKLQEISKQKPGIFSKIKNTIKDVLFNKDSMTSKIQEVEESFKGTTVDNIIKNYQESLTPKSENVTQEKNNVIQNNIPEKVKSNSIASARPSISSRSSVSTRASISSRSSI